MYNRRVLVLTTALLLAGAIPAWSAPGRTIRSGPQPPVAAGGGRNGGETIATSVGIWALPFHEDGTTEGFDNDYDESCPNPSDSPDVVYFLDNTDGRYSVLDIDLCGTDYDSKIYIYSNEGHLDPPVVCNDDGNCGGQPSIQSKIEAMSIGPHVYYIIIDGSNNASGGYTIQVDTPLGICCLADGRCFVTHQEGCAGAWQFTGPSPSCDPNPCPPPAVTGACCFHNATCRVLAPDTCSRLRGVYMGDGTTCDPNPCPRRVEPGGQELH